VGCSFSLQWDLLLSATGPKDSGLLRGWGFCGDKEDGANQIEIEMRGRPALTKGGENEFLLFLLAPPDGEDLRPA